MTIKKINALASALNESGATVAAALKLPVVELAPTTMSRPATQPSRVGMKSITMHQPEAVHRQIRLLAVEQGRTLEDVQAEAFNLLFAKYRKPEIAMSKVKS